MVENLIIASLNFLCHPNLHTADMRDAISLAAIPASVLLQGWQWAMQSCHSGHQLEVSELYCLPNSWIWIRLRIYVGEYRLGDSQETSDNQARVDPSSSSSPGIVESLTTMALRQAVHSIQTRCRYAMLTKGWPKYTDSSRKSKNRPL